MWMPNRRRSPRGFAGVPCESVWAKFPSDANPIARGLRKQVRRCVRRVSDVLSDVLSDVEKTGKMLNGDKRRSRKFFISFHRQLRLTCFYNV